MNDLSSHYISMKLEWLCKNYLHEIGVIASPERAHIKNTRKSWFQRIMGGGGGAESRYMPDYYRYAKYHHFLWSAILDFGLGIIILFWNCHKWPKLSLNWRITLIYQTGNDHFTTLPVSAAANFKMADYRISPILFRGGTGQILSLTSNELNKTIKPCSPFLGHES